MKRKVLLVTSAIVAVACLGGTAFAAADAAPTPAADQAQTSGSSSTPATKTDDSTTAVGEVIVTVNKRNESVEDVPVAVTAFSTAQREELGVISVFDMTRATPSFEYSSAIDRAFIRGIGRNTNAPGTQAGVALYIDGVYTPSTYGLDRATILSGTTEIDSGPQGTLFGRNSIGGVIQQNSAHANDQFQIQTDIKYNDHNRVDAAATIGGPIGDHLKLIYGIDYRSQTKGYFYNEALGTDAGGPTTERLNYALLDYSFGKVDGFVKLEYTGYNRKLSQFSQYGATYTDEPNHFNDFTATNGIGITENYNCVVDPATVPGNPAAPPTATIGGERAYTAGNCPTNVPQATSYYDPTNVTATNPFLIKQDTQTFFKSHNDWDAVDQTTWHLPWFDMKYIGGYTQYVYNNNQDYDNTARGVFGYDPDGPAGSSAVFTGYVGGVPQTAQVNLPAVNIYPTVYDYYENRKWQSHELDFSSNSKGPLSWVAGLYYYQDDFLNNTGVAGPGQTQLNLIAGVSNPQDNYYSTSGDAKTRSQAVFGQADYQITPKWKLTAGLRVNSDYLETIEQDHYYAFVPSAANYNVVTGQYAGANYTPYLLEGSCTALGADPTKPADQFNATTRGAECKFDATDNIRTIKDNWTGWGGTVNLSYKPDDASLLYVKYSRGYKAGGLVVSGGMSTQPVLDPETLNAYEAGYKFSPNRTITLNGDVFYYDYRGYQDFGSVPNPNFTVVQPTVSVGFNVPKSSNVGVEVTGSWHPIHALTITMSGNYMDAKVEDGGTVCLVDQLDPGATGTTIVTNQDGTRRTYTYKPTTSSKCPASYVTNGTTNVFQSITGDVLKGSSPWKVYLSPQYRLDFRKGRLT